MSNYMRMKIAKKYVNDFTSFASNPIEKAASHAGLLPTSSRRRKQDCAITLARSQPPAALASESSVSRTKRSTTTTTRLWLKPSPIGWGGGSPGGRHKSVLVNGGT